MNRAIVILGLVAVVPAGASFALWHHNPTVFGGGFTVSEHGMGETAAEFAKVEAKRYTINLDDCDGIASTPYEFEVQNYKGSAEYQRIAGGEDFWSVFKWDGKGYLITGKPKS